MHSQHPVLPKSIILHGAAMEGTVLADDSAAVDAHNLAVGEGLSDDSQGFGIEVGLVVGGYEYGTIDDQIVGISGRKPVFVVVDGARQGEFQETIGLTL